MSTRPPSSRKKTPSVKAGVLVREGVQKDALATKETMSVMQAPPPPAAESIDGKASFEQGEAPVAPGPAELSQKPRCSQTAMVAVAPVPPPPPAPVLRVEQKSQREKELEAELAMLRGRGAGVKRAVEDDDDKDKDDDVDNDDDGNDDESQHGGSDDEDNGGDDGTFRGSARSEKQGGGKRGRGRSARTVTLAEQTQVLKIVAANNFFAAGYGKTGEWEKKCMAELKAVGLSWTIPRLKRFVVRIVDDYEKMLAQDDSITGNVADWLISVGEDVSKIAAAVKKKEEKKESTGKKKAKKEEAKLGNEEHRQEVHKKLKEKFGGPESAARHLNLKKTKRREGDNGDDDIAGADLDTDAGGAVGRTPSSSGGSSAKRTSKTDLIRAEVTKEERKKMAEENRKLELELQHEKLALEQKRFEMEKEERLVQLQMQREMLEFLKNK